MSPDLKRAMRVKSPVANVSAAPLETNMLEWHCNIRHNGNIYHLILFFTKEYPYVSPSAEFVPMGFNFRGGGSMSGQKGTKIYLSIFSDFADFHAEWQNDTYSCWSPGYTVQTVLLNLVSVLGDLLKSHGGRDPYHAMCKIFVCKDCGHEMRKPFSPLNEKQPNLTDDTQLSEHQEDETDDNFHDFTSKIVDYMSKEKFPLSKPTSTDQLFGYGLMLSGFPKHTQLNLLVSF